MIRGRVKESGSADNLSELVSSESLLDLATRILIKDFGVVERTKAYHGMDMPLFGYQMTTRPG
jgi:hypothetical protein